MIEKYLSLIKSNELFMEISNEKILEVISSDSVTISSYKKSNIIHLEGECCISLDIILKGEVIIQRIDEDGNVLTIVDFHSGDSIGGNLLFSNQPYYPMTIIAKAETQILHLNKNLVLDLCQFNKAFLTGYLAAISDKTTILSNKIKTISLKSIRTSIIEYLKYEYYLQNSNKIRLTMTKKELAERLGVQRTSLSRELNKMKITGLIDYDSQSITILDNSIIK